MQEVEKGKLAADPDFVEKFEELGIDDDALVILIDGYVWTDTAAAAGEHNSCQPIICVHHIAKNASMHQYKIQPS